MSGDAMAQARALVERLRDPACHPNPVETVGVLETHVSWVLLAGAFAYKLKKPVSLPFLDYGSLELRHHFCAEELRLNRRTAPMLYQAVVAITGTLERPRIGGEGPVLEYAVRMARFEQSALFDTMAGEGRLTVEHVVALGRHVAAFHASLPRQPPPGEAGRPELVLRQALANFATLRPACPDPDTAGRLDRLEAWTREASARMAASMARRLAEERVRECHGDLHLGNVAWIEGAAVAFDGIDFDPALRWTDVAADVAFTVMDLLHHGLPGLAWRFLDEYLTLTGDHDLMTVLRFHLVYRALVRAAVAAVRAAQTADAAQARAGLASHLALAEQLANAGAPVLVLMHGVSGSGKSHAAARILERLGGARVRSDVERKRLAGLGPLRSTASVDGIYGPAFNTRVYDRLAELADAVLGAGWPVIVDAACLRRSERDRFRALAAGRHGPFRLVHCEAPVEVMRARLARRALAGDDPSEATQAVLVRQLAAQELLAPDEPHATVGDDPACDAVADAIECLARERR
jgi:aminoglycoside phosphotransferase family enzyme/predicted kinase